MGSICRSLQLKSCGALNEAGTEQIQNKSEVMGLHLAGELLSEDAVAAKSLPGYKERLNKFMKGISTKDQAPKSLILEWEECRREASYLPALILRLPCAYTCVRKLRYLGFDLT